VAKTKKGVIIRFRQVAKKLQVLPAKGCGQNGVSTILLKFGRS